MNSKNCGVCSNCAECDYDNCTTFTKCAEIERFKQYLFSSEQNNSRLVAEILELKQSLFISEESTISLVSVIKNLSAEIAELKNAAPMVDNMQVADLKEEIEQLNAKVAMMSEAIKEIWYSNSTPIPETKYYEVINATEAYVTKWLNGVEVRVLREAYKSAYDANTSAPWGVIAEMIAKREMN